MSQEIDKKVETPESETAMESLSEAIGIETRMCGLAIMFNVLGILTLFAAFLVVAYLEVDVLLVLIGGIIVAMFDFALAVIVDACDKYRKSH